MIFKITTITSSADTAIVTSMDMRDFHSTLNHASTLTCSHKVGNVVNAADVVFTCTGADTAETQLNVNRLQTWFSNLMGQSHLGNMLSKVYVMNQATITADAGLTFTGADTAPLTTTVVA